MLPSGAGHNPINRRMKTIGLKTRFNSGDSIFSEFGNEEWAIVGLLNDCVRLKLQMKTEWKQCIVESLSKIGNYIYGLKTYHQFAIRIHQNTFSTKWEQFADCKETWQESNYTRSFNSISKRSAIILRLRVKANRQSIRILPRTVDSKQIDIQQTSIQFRASLQCNRMEVENFSRQHRIKNCKKHYNFTSNPKNW